MVDETLREFYDSLTREEAAMAEWIAADEYGLVMRIAINEMDLELEGVHRNGPATDEDHQRAYLMRLGVNRVIKLALDAHPQFIAPTWTVQRKLAASAPVLALISDLGKIGHGRRVAQSLAARSGRIEKRGDGYGIILPARVVDDEMHERELDEYYVQRGRREFELGPQAYVDAKIGDEVRSLLTELVYPYGQHFIGYESDPALDVYFYGRGYNEIQLAKGYDAFHFSTRFGGMTFQHYKLAAAFILQSGHRHRAFVQALLEKDRTIRIEDVLTVSGETSSYLENMRDFINYWGEAREGHVPVTEEGVRILFDVLSVSRRNRALLDRPGAPIPPLVQCSEEHVIKVLSGANADILLFLLNSLQHHFPKDYDRAQREREGVMQRGVEGMLRSALADLGFRGNIKLRQNGKVLTDLDLVAVDASADRVILFQLKHQDHYGADLATMLSRTARLNQQVSEWLVKVRAWLAAATASEVRATLRLPTAAARPTVSLMVVTRHFAHSLRSVVDGGDAAFSNWAQLATATARMRDEPEAGSLDRLIAILRELSVPEEKFYLPEPPSEWRVGELCFTIEQIEE
ncbi:MAG TPA: hypothetical protein VGW40_04035 [Allosphingosinicella sp.]|nr:hypothetical protein [Allosphingosinicella sp.]